jgi:hypothetical protein
MKLSGWTIIVLGVCLGAMAFFYVFFDVYQPNEVAAGYMKAYKEQLETEAGKQKRADARVLKAMQKVTEAAHKWNFYVDKNTPPDSLAGGGVNLTENDYQLVVDSPKFRNSAQRAFNAQLRSGGVKIVSAPEIPAPTMNEKDILASYYNYPALSKIPLVLWELGSVTVSGSYSRIMQNVRSWSNMPHYLAVVDGLRIDGTSPNLTATYNVTILGFIKAQKLYPNPPVNIGGETKTQSGPGALSGPGGGSAGPAPAGPSNQSQGNTTPPPPMVGK